MRAETHAFRSMVKVEGAPPVTRVTDGKAEPLVQSMRPGWLARAAFVLLISFRSMPLQSARIDRPDDFLRHKHDCNHAQTVVALLSCFIRLQRNARRSQSHTWQESILREHPCKNAIGAGLALRRSTHFFRRKKSFFFQFSKVVIHSSRMTLMNFARTLMQPSFRH